MSKRWEIEARYGRKLQGGEALAPWCSTLTTPCWHVTATHRDSAISATAHHRRLGSAVWLAKLDARIKIFRAKRTLRQMLRARRRGWLQ